MPVTADDIRPLDDKVIGLTFANGCSMDVKVLETMHLDEGEDFAADVVRIHCRSSDHWHPQIGDAINIRLADIAHLRRLD